jgi:hypothetical protein
MNQLYRSRLLTIEGYSLWTESLVADGWSAYFVNFMFKHLPTRPSCFGDPMEDGLSGLSCLEVEESLPKRFHGERRTALQWSVLYSASKPVAVQFG